MISRFLKWLEKRLDKYTKKRVEYLSGKGKKYD